MLRATHVNQTMTVGLLYLIKSMTFSIVLFFLPILAIIQDWDHKQGFLAKHFKISIPGKHRGITHTLIFILFVILLINLFGILYVNNFNLSILNLETFKEYINNHKVDNIYLFILLHGHLLGDFLTKNGIPYFYPFIKKNIGLGLFSTRGQKSKFDVTGEMWLNFIHSIINILLFIFIIKQWDTYSKVILEPMKALKESGNMNLLILLIGLQLIFVFTLFIKDIRSSVDFMGKFTKNLLKILIFIAIGVGLSLIVYGLFIFFHIDLNNVFLSFFHVKPNYDLNSILYVSIIAINIFWALNLTKKYLISLSSTISYTLNSIYILVLMGLFIIA